DLAQQTAVHAVVIAILLGVALIILRPVILELAWFIIQPEPDLRFYASQYIHIRLWAAPAALINLLVLGVLLGRQQAKYAMGLVIFTKDRKSTRLNSSHVKISYAVFCLKKKKIYII